MRDFSFKKSSFSKQLPWSVALRLSAAWLLLTSCFLLPSGAGDNKTSGPVKESILAGSWYPASPQELRSQITEFLNKVPPQESQGRLTALIAPHAGYAYSGSTAACAYKLLEKNQFPTVVIIAPSHHARFPGASVYEGDGFRTPLGVVQIDQDFVKALKARESQVRNVPEVFAKEHALEIQLPFLQVVMPGCKVIPLIMGEQDIDTCRRLAEALSDTIRGKQVLIVASSDLSHFHTYDKAKELDRVVADRVKALDVDGLYRDLEGGRCEACGGGPMLTAMLAAKRLGVGSAQVLHTTSSGDVTGDRSRVVGYMAAALWADNSQAAPDVQKQPSSDGKSALTPEEKADLHRIAKESIETGLKDTPAPRIQSVSERLKEPRGAFVTLHKRGDLRGCIGQIVAYRPLAETVSEMARAAAFRDPRFSPVTSSEWQDISIEISVLTPLEKIGKVEDIKVGVHGIYMKLDGRSGLLLPQVATENHWDRETFLENTCRKCGLPKDAWKDKKAEIYIFSADVF